MDHDLVNRCRSPRTASGAPRGLRHACLPALPLLLGCPPAASTLDDGLEARVAALEALTTTQAEALTSLQAQLDAQAAELDAQAKALAAVGGATVLTEDLELTVGSVAELEAALDTLDALRVPRGRRVTVQVSAGTYRFSAPLALAHPDGARIHLEGQGAEAVQWEFSANTGVVVEGGAWGGLGGLSLHGSGPAAVHVRGGVVGLGELTVEGFETGLLVEQGAVWPDAGIAGASHPKGWLTVRDCGVGLHARHGGNILAPGAVVEGARGAGALAEFGSSLDVSWGNVHTGYDKDALGWSSGVVAQYASGVNAAGTLSESNAGTGFLASSGGALYAYGSESWGNWWGYTVERGSYADLGAITAAANSYTGVELYWGSTALGDETTLVHSNSGAGLTADVDASAYIPGITVRNNGGCQVQATQDSYLSLPDARLDGANCADDGDGNPNDYHDGSGSVIAY